MPKFLDEKGLQLLGAQISLAIQTAKEELESFIETKIQEALGTEASTTDSTVDPEVNEQGEDNPQTSETEAEGSVL